MTREALADRVLNYSDALAAFSLVNAFAFLITLAEPDIRCSIARIASLVIGINLTLPVAITAGLLALRRFELSLRDPGAEDASVRRFWSWVQAVRLGLVWLVASFVTLGVWAASLDPRCVESGR